MILYMGIFLYAPTLALSAVTNLPKWTTIIVIGAVCTIYCVCGGIKAGNLIKFYYKNLMINLVSIASFKFSSL